MMANETILLTGATGQVGRRLVPRLLSWREPGDEVRVLVRTAEAAERFEAAGARAVIGDLTGAADRERALDGVAVVVNSAASFRGPTQSAEEMYAVNRDAAVALARESARSGVRRFVHVSTSLVYGPGVGRPVREEDALRADDAARFGSYADSKRQAEERLRELSNESGLDIVTLRLAFVYGEGDPHLEQVLPRFASRAAHDRLSMVHHADVAQSVQRAIGLPRESGGYAAYNIAGDAASTAYEVYDLAGRSFDLAAAAERVVADPWFGVTDSTRAYRELGFRPLYPTARAAWRAGAL